MSRPAGTYAIFETSQGNIVIRLLEKEAAQDPWPISSVWPREQKSLPTK